MFKALTRIVLLGATFAVPAVASATVRSQTGIPNSGGNPPGFATQSSFGGGSLGGGVMWGSDFAHVSSPGRAPIDNDSRGPVDDAQVIQPSTGNLKSTVNPKPVH
jgi:hypothetical protein